MKPMGSEPAVDVVSFYRFVNVAEPEALREPLAALCQRHSLLGTILLAGEGVNGTLAGGAAGIAAVLDWLAVRLELAAPLRGRRTRAAAPPFRRMKVRVKAEIVTLGRPDIRPQDGTGRRVAPEDWNALIDAPETLVIDTRNRYEHELGTFPRALDPGTDGFREFAAFAGRLQGERRDRPVAMFCTGGIRCEKAAALLGELGFTRVYQLEGGILNYLERVPDANKRWHGECFVFDDRVAVDRDLAEGGYQQCHACRRPLTSEDLESPQFRPGVSCPHCAAA